MFLLCIFLVRFLYLSQDAIISKKLKRFVSEWKSSWEGGLTRWWGSIQVEKCPNLGFSTRSHYWWDKRVKLFQQDEALKLCSKPKCGDWNCKIQSRLDVDFSGHLILPWLLIQVYQWTIYTSFFSCIHVCFRPVFSIFNICICICIFQCLYVQFPIFAFSISNICIWNFQYLYLQFPSAARTGCSGRVTSGYPPLRPQAAHEKWQFRAERSIVQIQIQKQKQKQIQIQTQ